MESVVRAAQVAISITLALSSERISDLSVGDVNPTQDALVSVLDNLYLGSCRRW
jgi:hypothetical protein